MEHINRCIGLVVEKADEWLAAIKDYDAGVDERIAALIAEATAIRRTRGELGRLEHWIRRTGIDGAAYPAYHIEYAEIPRPPSADPAQRDAEELEAMLASYAGGLAPVAPASEDDYAAQRKRVVGPAPDVVPDVDLRELDEDELVEWMMGCGTFDGQARPDEAAVIAAAEGNATMARRLLAAERRANETAPRPRVIDELGRIGGAP
jgi:hypothetical protein